MMLRLMDPGWVLPEGTRWSGAVQIVDTTGRVTRTTKRVEHRTYALHAQLVLEVPDPVKPTSSDQVIGIDAGVKIAVAVSDGRAFHMPDETDHRRPDQGVAAIPVALHVRVASMEPSQQTRYAGCMSGAAIYATKPTATSPKPSPPHVNICAVGAEITNNKGMVVSAAGTAEHPGTSVAAKRTLNRLLHSSRFAGVRAAIERACAKVAKLYVPVPAPGTSSMCHRCGGKGIRESQAVFRCPELWLGRQRRLQRSTQRRPSNLHPSLNRLGVGKTRRPGRSSLDGRTGETRPAHPVTRPRPSPKNTNPTMGTIVYKPHKVPNVSQTLRADDLAAGNMSGRREIDVPAGRVGRIVRDLWLLDLTAQRRGGPRSEGVVAAPIIERGRCAALAATAARRRRRHNPTRAEAAATAAVLHLACPPQYELLARFSHDNNMPEPEEYRRSDRYDLREDSLICWNVMRRQDLQRLVASPISDPARERLAADPACPPVYLTALSVDSCDEVRQAVAANPACPPVRLAALSVDSDNGVREAVAANPSCPAAIVAALAESPWKRVRRAVAANPSCSAAIVAALASDHWEVAAVAMSHPACPQPVLRQAANSSDNRVREAVAANPGCPADILAMLALDAFHEVRSAVLANLACPSEVLAVFADELDPLVRTAAAAHPAAAALLESFAGSDDKALRSGAASNSSTSPTQLRRLVKDPTHEVRVAAAANPNCPSGALRRAVRGPRWPANNETREERQEIRSAVAANPSCPPAVLHKMTKSVDMVGLVAANPATPAESFNGVGCQHRTQSACRCGLEPVSPARSAQTCGRPRRPR